MKVTESHSELIQTTEGLQKAFTGMNPKDMPFKQFINAVLKSNIQLERC